MALVGQLLYSVGSAPRRARRTVYIRTGGAHMSNDIVGQGLELMLYGRYFPEAAAAASARAMPGKQGASGGEVHEEVVAAIGAAIHQHRKNRS